MAAAAGNMLDLEALVAASRDAAMGGSETATDQLHLPQVASHAQHLLAAIQQHRRELRGGGSVTTPPVPAREDDPQLAEQQGELLLCFCIFRNAAAAGPCAAAALLSCGLLELAGSTLDLLASAAIPLNWQLPAALAQALANFCTASREAAAAAWSALFPLHLSMLAHVTAGSTQAATCLALLACCRVLEGASAALVGEQGSQLMTALLCNQQRMLHQGQHNDTLGLLVAHLCFQRDLMPSLFTSLGAGPRPGDGEGEAASGAALAAVAVQPTMAQSALLGLLCEEAQEVLQARGHATQEGTARRGASMAFLVELVQLLAGAGRAAELTPGQQQVLQEALHLMRDVCARDDSGRGLAVAGGSSACIEQGPSPDLVAELQAAGAVPALLAMLKALEPIQNPQQQRVAADDGVAARDSSGGIRVAELAPLLAGAAARFPSAPPYPGFRSDLLAVLANAAHGRRCQDEVGRLGGVELVLAQCQLDRQSPLAREWALWAVRNLCEGNPEAQEAIRQLHLCTTVESEELQRLGVKLELDEQTGKLRVTKRDLSGAGRAAGAPAAGPLS
ncbi:hypothetical protein ABPG77_002373 [Micractinium sp. CCAP 211/92]